MKISLAIKIFGTFLIAILIAPSMFLIAPQRVYAQGEALAVPTAGVGTNDFTTAIKSAFSAVKETLIEVHTYTSAVADYAQWVNTYVLQPLAFVMSGNLLKMITASVLKFVTGATNGTGAPQFVQNLQGNLQRVGDIQANAFFLQLGRNSNSPFASAITSSLRNNYLWNTSSAGFFAANRSTLGQYSANPSAFLAGNWSQGGIGAWFALTTKNQNNPYTLYQASQAQLASVVAGASSARLAELNWGQGFFSWCSSATSAENPTSSADAWAPLGTAPGDACKNADGTPGTIKTPGSTIKAALDKALGTDQDKLVQMGAVAKEIGGILSNIGTVFQTVNLASQILGGTGSGGLFGVGQTSGTQSTSRLVQYQTSPGYFGVTGTSVLENSGDTISSSDMRSRVTSYEAAWGTIRSAATAASVALESLAAFCTSAASSNSNISSAATAQASAARAAITNKVAPVLAEADAAATAATAARAMAAKVESEVNSGDTGAYVADSQTLQTMAPTARDLTNAQEDAQVSTFEIASPTGSLNVSDGSIVGRMNLMATNAEALKTTACTEAPPP